MMQKSGIYEMVQDIRAYYGGHRIVCRERERERDVNVSGKRVG